MVTRLSICSVVLFVLINFASAQNPCKTPDDLDGKCIALPQCLPLYKLSTLESEQQDFLRKSQCGFDGKTPLVCCPNTPNTFTLDDLPYPGKQCGLQVTEKIFGGGKAHLTEFPWLALLHYKKPGTGGSFSCGGSLIHESYVLTAAHCIRGLPITRNKYDLDIVRLGEHDLQTNPDCLDHDCNVPFQDIPIADKIVHEGYNPYDRSQEHDIALIRLKYPATITNFTRPICLPIYDLKDKNYDGMTLHVAGFGRTENAPRSQVKLKVDVNGFNLAECKNVYQRDAVNLGSSVLCAGGSKGKDSCTGDSGGPLVAKEIKDSVLFFHLVGVVSQGPKECGAERIPAVYTRVDKYIDWIVDHMRK